MIQPSSASASDLVASTSPQDLFKKAKASAESKQTLVNSLVCSTSILLSTLWADFDTSSASDSLNALNTFIISSLRRSRSSNLTLQVALYYLVRLSNHIKACILKKFHNKHLYNAKSKTKANVLLCKKRTFLTCLILASKFVQDKNYSMKSWSIISGLPVKELVHNETVVLNHLSFNLYVKGEVFTEWSSIISYFIMMFSKSNSTSTLIKPQQQTSLNKINSQWKLIIDNLDPTFKLSKSINYFNLLVSNLQNLESAPIFIESY
ncbi:Pcl5 protein [Saccharomycopsis crataegensis]|uniref:Pcl5 protein n=1 Tax=Saccharomycopsis crataegensis TaxID=43959 RepID=A0AAV5QNW0_9ASCO|nr:Pcl5 protein [Saccharomycopsis crataegensis]